MKNKQMMEDTATTNNKRREIMHRREKQSSTDDANNGEGDDENVVRSEDLESDLLTMKGFQKYRDDLLSRISKSVKSRFREGRFCKWGKEWLPVLELGPFDVEPGPVRDMWLEMFENSQKRGRGMKRLVYWYGVQYEDRGQAYSFVTTTQLINYDEGEKKGYGNIPKKMQNKIAQKNKFSKKEEQLNRGLLEIEMDMSRDKSERAHWMMQFKERHEIAAEESIREEARSKLISMCETTSSSSSSPPKSKKSSFSKSKVEGKSSSAKRKLGKSKKDDEKNNNNGDNDDDNAKIKRKSSVVMPDGVVSSSCSSLDGNDNNVTPSSSSSTPPKKRPRTGRKRSLAGDMAERVPSRVSSLDNNASDATTTTTTTTDRSESNNDDDGERTPRRKTRPTPSECHLVVRELGKLHPDVIDDNDRRRESFALRTNRSAATSSSSSDDVNATPITDAIINTMLSQNTTAANQERAYASLKEAYPGGWDQLANETDASRIEDAIRVAGLAQVRAERIRSMLRTVRDERGSADFEFLRRCASDDEVSRELSRHKGMGPKTVSCVLLFALGKADFPVDTHVLRISKMMGWVPMSYTREAAYEHLNGRVPNECKLDLHCLLVTHGKQCHKCAARGRAQFPPREEWVCPMAAIRNGAMTGAVDAGGCAATTTTSRSSSSFGATTTTATTPAVVKGESSMDNSTPQLKAKQLKPQMNYSNRDIKVKVERVSPWCDS